MDRNKNYYAILGVSNIADKRVIKKAYYTLSFKNHPDKGGDASIFSEMTEAYDILMNTDTKSEYDLKSKWGSNYNEYYDLFDVDFNLSYQSEKDRLEKFKKNEVYNIQIDVDNKFSGVSAKKNLMRSLNTDPSKGLSSPLVKKMRDEFGSNKMPVAPMKTFFKCLSKHLKMK